MANAPHYPHPPRRRRRPLHFSNRFAPATSASRRPPALARPCGATPPGYLAPAPPRGRRLLLAERAARQGRAPARGGLRGASAGGGAQAPPLVSPRPLRTSRRAARCRRRSCMLQPRSAAEPPPAAPRPPAPPPPPGSAPPAPGGGARTPAV